MTYHTFEGWSGNILSNDGAWLHLGEVRAHVVRRAHDIWMRGLSSSAQRPWKRSWIVAIFNCDPLRIGQSEPLVELIAFDKSPDQVRAEAKRLAEWCACFYSGDVT